MNNLSILQELFESDTVIFMIIGMVIAIMIGLQMKRQRMHVFAIIISIVVYAFCEFVSNLYANFSLAFILLLIGTISIGCCIGFVICYFFRWLTKRKDER